jgi:hypothetical protein
MDARKKKIIIVTSVIGALVLVATAILARRLAKRKALERTLRVVSPNIGTGEAEYSGGPLIIWPVKNGSGYLSSSERDVVRTIQRYLNKKINQNNIYSLPLLVVDGYFGSKTENALSKIAGVRQVSYTLFHQMDAYLGSNLFDKQYSTIDET